MSKRRRKPSRGGRKNFRRSARGGIAVSDASVHRRDDPFTGNPWEALRQGARNVAGVRYQLLVTAYLLAESRRGTLPFVELIPEGFEDIDCFDRDSRRWLVPVKEVGAGAGSFTASSVAEVVSRAARVADRPHRIVVVTDGQLGSQLVESGWDRSISEISGPGLDKVLDALLKRGHQPDEAQRLARRTHLIRVPWNAAPLLTRSISESFDLMPAVAAIVSSRLIDDLSEIAADQRLASVHSPGRRGIGDLDVLVANVHQVVAVEGLDSALRSGICEVADYATRPGAGLALFLQGVDVLPAHIGADFDVIRPVPCRAVQIGLEQARYVLITGPSGAGKSAQMWRSARDVARGAQVVRVHRLEKDRLKQPPRISHYLARSLAALPSHFRGRRASLTGRPGCCTAVCSAHVTWRQRRRLYSLTLFVMSRRVSPVRFERTVIPSLCTLIWTSPSQQSSFWPIPPNMLTSRTLNGIYRPATMEPGISQMIEPSNLRTLSVSAVRNSARSRSGRC